MAKRRRRASTADLPMGPPARRSTVLTPLEEVVVVEFRRRTFLLLDDALVRLRERTPGFPAAHCTAVSGATTSADCRAERASKRGRFAETRLGYVHVDASELRTAEGKVHLLLATYVEPHSRADMTAGVAFLRGVVAAFRYAIHTVLTDNRVAFSDAPRYWDGLTPRMRGHAFNHVCWRHRIAHKLT